MANNTSPLKPTLITCFQNVTTSPMLIATLGMQGPYQKEIVLQNLVRPFASLEGMIGECKGPPKRNWP